MISRWLENRFGTAILRPRRSSIRKMVESEVKIYKDLKAIITAKDAYGNAATGYTGYRGTSGYTGETGYTGATGYTGYTGY